MQTRECSSTTTLDRLIGRKIEKEKKGNRKGKCLQVIVKNEGGDDIFFRVETHTFFCVTSIDI